MSIQVKFRRGTATQHNSFTGAEGEITVDTTNKTLRVHDNSTVGGIRLAKSSEVANLQFVTTNIVPSANVTFDLGSPERRWRDLYLSGNTINLGGFKIGGETGAVVFRNQDDDIIGEFDSLNPSIFSGVTIANSNITDVILNGVLGPTYGGTGFTSLTPGGVLFAANTTTYNFATGTSGQVLTIVDGAPAFVNSASLTISGDADGGTY
jgi:hypothetical protein